VTELLAALREAFPDVACSVALGQAELTVPRERIRDVARELRARGFRLLLDITAVDRMGERPRFEVVYHLYHLELSDWLRLKVRVDSERPELPSVTGIFPAANWPERECYDMFGIRFTGHPDLRRILMPDDWEGHPLRKDYPLPGLRPLPPLVHPQPEGG